MDTSSCAIFKESIPEWYDAINTYIELKGRYRFLRDPDYGQILDRFHQGRPLPSDFDTINQRVVQRNGKTLDGDEIPEGIRYCTPNNRESDAINCGIFYKRIKDCSQDNVLILSSKLKIKQNRKEKQMSNIQNPQAFYQQCGENDCKFAKTQTSRMDPVLKLYYRCPVMLTNNINVDSGLANGTEAKVLRIVMKTGQTTFKVKIDVDTHNQFYESNQIQEVSVDAAYAEQIKFIELEHVNKNIHPKIFQLQPKDFTFDASFPCPPEFSGREKRIQRKMNAQQLPVIANSATTGHKLQGATCENLFINAFNYRANWPYVALSRVKTLKGLYLRQPLDSSKDFSCHPKLIQMYTYFRTSKLVTDSYFDDI